MLKPPDSYWGAKALLLRIMDTTPGNQLWIFFAKKQDGRAFQFTSTAKSQRACALIGVLPTLDNKTALCVAVKRIAAQEDSDAAHSAYQIGK